MGGDILKTDKTPTIYSASYYNLGGLGVLFPEAEPTKASPVATGPDGHLTNIKNKQAGKFK